MKKRTISLLLCVSVIMSMFYCVAGIPASAATVESSAVSATQSQTNISLRADAMYGCKWTAKATCYGWRGNYTYSKGSEYRIPYGQPVSAGKYVGFSISVPDFLTATTSASNIFYTTKSNYNGATSTYYANDCSAFVSYCWGISRNTTSSLGNVSTSYGLCNSSNVDKLKLGDALNCAGSHVVLVSGITYSGSTVSSVEITEQTPPQLKRTTYTRSGLVSKYGSSYKILRYTGSVSAPTFKFTFDANGGSGTMTDQTINYGVATDIKTNKFTKSGYNFKGWNVYRQATKLWAYTNGTTSGWYEKGSQPSGYSLKVYKDETSVSKTGYGVGDTVTLKAVWEEAQDKTFTFRFMPNGGEGEMADQVITYGTDTAIKANKFTNSGKTFSGWYAYRSADKTWRYTNGTDSAWCVKGEQPAGYYRYRYSDGATVAKTGKGTGDIVKLYAVWAGANYTVKYAANGGSGTMANSSYVNGIEKTLTANAYTKSGNTFGGWSLTRKSDGKTRYMLDDDNAGWYIQGEQPKGYRLQLYPDQKPISQLSSVEGDVVTLTAYWKPKTTGTQTYYFDFYPDGGSGTMARQAITYGVKVPLSKCTFTKPGYKFKAWRGYRASDNKWRFKNADGTAKWAVYGSQPAEYTITGTYPDEANVSESSSVDGDVISLYAEWEEDFKFTFKFDANGGTGSMPNQLITYGTNTAISKNKFTRPGYKFVGWNAHRLYDNTWRFTDGTSAGFYPENECPEGYDSLFVYQDEHVVAKTGIGLEDTVVLRAVWEEDFKFTVKFDANGGTGTMADVLVTYGVNTTMPKSTFTRAGYKFSGWNCHRLADDTWRYTNGEITNAWYKEGEQPEGYSLFKYKDETTISKSGTGLDDVVIFKAVWAEDFKFTVKYFANGGSGKLADQLITYNVSTPLSKNTFTRAGYKFAGWNAYRTADNTWRYTNGTTTGWYQEGTQPEGYELSVYKDEAKVAKTGLGLDDVVNMYAVWEEIKYGDADNDGVVSIKDATEIQKVIAYETVLSDELFELCDVNKDGRVNIKDVTLIQKYIAGLVDSLK